MLPQPGQFRIEDWDNKPLHGPGLYPYEDDGVCDLWCSKILTNSVAGSNDAGNTITSRGYAATAGHVFDYILSKVRGVTLETWHTVHVHM